MPAGLTIYNDSGTVQIDESWRNYGFKQRIPASISVNVPGSVPAGYNGQPYSMTVSGEDVLIACRAETLLPVLMHTYADGGSWTYNWLFMPPFIGATYSETVEFYVFDLLPMGGFSNVGLEVFNAAGQRVFHSDADMMKVRGIQGCDTGFSGVGGRSYVPLIARNPIYGVNMGFPTGNRLWSHCLRVSGSSIVTETRQLGSFGALGAYSNAGAYAAIDVTGLS
ncbi:MAG: hypothetical protein DI527_01075 [Chelatococcus sp.]|nr:MAG: hypothetical protein DI527_01075 [Chelatococcus sp.]